MKLSLVLLLIISYLPTIEAQNMGISFRGFNQENFTDLNLDFSSLQNMIINQTQVTAQQTSAGVAIADFNVEEISDSIDIGMLRASLSLNTVSNGSSKQVSVSLIFSPTSSSDDVQATHQTFTRTTQTENVSESLGGDVLIPTGTRYIFVELNASSSSSSETVVFSNLSLKIKDEDIPTLTSNRSDAWQSTHQLITVTASDFNSGIKGIYDASNDREVSMNGSYSYLSQTGVTREFYAIDYADHKSAILRVAPSKVDDQAPAQAPAIYLSHSGWTSSNVSFNVQYIDPLEGSDERRQYRLNDGEWVDFENELEVSSEGITVIQARIIDEAGNASEVSEETIYIDKTAPLVTNIQVKSQDAGSLITFEVADDLSQVKRMSWMKGEQTAETVRTQGTEITSPTFTVTSSGTYTLVVEDNAGNIFIKFISANTSPIIAEISDVTLVQDTTKTISVEITDAETSIENMTISVISLNQMILPNPTFTRQDHSITLVLEPLEGMFGGPITVKIVVTDEENNVTEATFNVTVNRFNEEPITVPDTYRLDESTPSHPTSITVNPLENDRDDDLTELIIDEISTSTHATVTISADKKNVTFSPNQYYNGTVELVYTVSDGVNKSSSTITFIVNSINQAPEAKNDTYTIDEDIMTSFPVLLNDLDVDLGTTAGEKLTIISVQNPTFGSVTFSENAILYTPKLNWSGTESFTYTIKDQENVTSTATITVHVNAVNDLPTFEGLASQMTIQEDNGQITIQFTIQDIETITSSLMLQVLSTNDAIIPSSSIHVDGLGSSNGIITIKFQTKENVFGTGGLRFRLSDGFGLTQKNLEVVVEPVNDAPVAVADVLEYTEDVPLEFSIIDLLMNDYDIEHNDLSFVSIIDVPHAGNLEEISAGVYRYTPNENSDVVDSFTYQISDGNLVSIGQVTLQPIAVNDVPTIIYDPSSKEVYDEDEVATEIYFEVHDVETESQNLFVTFSSEKGTLVAADGIRYAMDGNRLRLIVTPVPNQSGTTALYVTVSDGEKYSTATATITFEPVNDAPQAVEDQIYTVRNASVTFYPLENDYDIENSSLNIVNVGEPSFGNLTTVGGKFTYTPELNRYGTVTIPYTISDGEATSTGTIKIIISKYAVAPDISGIANQFIYEDTQTEILSYTIRNRFGDSGFSTSLTSSDQSIVRDSSIQLVDLGTGEYTVQITPEANAYGEVIITIHAYETEGYEATKTFKLTVYPVDDAPVVEVKSVEVNEDQSIEIDILGSVTDVDSPSTSISLLEMVDQAEHGLLERTSTGYKYTPNTNFNGTDSFTYAITDGTNRVQATISISVNAVNDAPEAYTQQIVLENVKDASVTFNPLSGVWDVDQDTLTFSSIKSLPTFGEMTANEDGTLTYTRTVESLWNHGQDEISVEICDRTSLSDPEVKCITRRIVFAEEFDRWFISDTYVSMLEDTKTMIELNLANIDIEKVDIVAKTNTGTELSTDDFSDFDFDQHTVSFDPPANAYGDYEMLVTVYERGNSEPKSATLYIHIIPVNDAPTFTSNIASQTVNEDSGETCITITYEDIDSSTLSLITSVMNQDSTKPILTYENIKVVESNGQTQVCFTPLENAFGMATINLTISDGLLNDTLSFQVNVTSVNDYPIAEDKTIVLAEDTQVNFSLIDVNSDVEHDPLTVHIDEGPKHGSAKVNEDGSITYTPKADYYGSDSLTYYLNDGQGNSEIKTVTFTVENTPDVPVITGLESIYTINEDGELVIRFTVEDADGEDVNARIGEIKNKIISTDDITLVEDENGFVLTIKPKENVYGEENIEILFGSGVDEFKRQVIMIIRSVNDPVSAADDAFEITEDTPKTLEVLDNDKDVEDEHLKIIAVSSTLHGGKLHVNADGTMLYTPVENYYGSDEFTYTVSDSNNSIATAKVTLTISPVNDAPIVGEDTISIIEDSEFDLDLLKNDYDVEGDQLVLISVYDSRLSQSITFSNDGVIHYIPKENANGEDVFKYIVSDGKDTSVGTVRVNITAVNDAPVITKSSDNSGTWEMDEDSVGVFYFDATDAETEASNLILTMTSKNTSLIPNENMQISGKDKRKTLTLTPLGNLSGTVDIEFTISDGEKTTVTVLSVVINPVNDAPIFPAIAISVKEDVTYSGKLLATDIDSSTLKYTKKTDAAHGTVTVLDNGNFTYKPIDNYNGTDSFVVTVDDLSGANNAQVDMVVSVNVTPVNDAPVASVATDSVNEDQSITINLVERYVTDVDLDPTLNLGNVNEVLSIVSVTPTVTGKVNITISGDKKTVTLTPIANFNGPLTFNYIVRDSANALSSSTITLTVTAVNDAPSGGDDEFTTYEDQPKTLNVLFNDDVDIKTNPDQEELTIISFDDTDLDGEIRIEDNQFVYTPVENWYGDTSFKYTMKDKAGETGTFTVVIHVESVNDLPTISSVAKVNINEDESSQPLRVTVSDIEDLSGDLIISATSSNDKIIKASNIQFTTNGFDERYFTITPEKDANGTVTIVLKITDRDGGYTTTSFEVVIKPVNDQPVATTFDTSVDEDEVLTFEMLSKLIDVDFNEEINEGNLDQLTITLDDDSKAINGESSITDGILTYKPSPNFNGTTTLNYHVSDSSGNPVSGVIIIKVNPVNDAPTIKIDAPIEMIEDEVLNHYAARVSDIETIDLANALVLSAESLTPSKIATNQISIKNPVINEGETQPTLTIRPIANQNGAAQIKLTLKDEGGFGETTTLIVDVMISPVNDAPSDGNDAYVIKEDSGEHVFSVLINDDLDTKIEGDSLTIISVTGNGSDDASLSISEDRQKILFTPKLNYYGTYVFNYTMRDAAGLEATFSVTVSVTNVNDAPKITAISNQTIDESGDFSVDFTISDVDNLLSELSLKVTSSNQRLFTTSNNTTFTSLGEGVYRLTLSANGKWNGYSDFTITVSDKALSAESKFTVTVRVLNDAPLASDDTATMTEDGGSVTLNVLTNDFDADIETNGDVLSVASYTTPAHGTLTIATDGSLVYTPEENYNGVVEFTYVVRDSGLVGNQGFKNDEGLVTITITPENDAPIATNQTLTIKEDEFSTFTIDLLAYVSDVDTSELKNRTVDYDFNAAKPHIKSIGTIAKGTLTLENNLAVYTPVENYNGTLIFSYIAEDAKGLTSEATITLNITPSNDAPVVHDQKVELQEDQSSSLNFWTKDVDIDFDVVLNTYAPISEILQITILERPQHGIYEVIGGILKYIPTKNFNGDDSLRYKVCDQALACAEATITYEVIPENDTPETSDQTIEIKEDEIETIDVRKFASDIDQDVDLNTSSSYKIDEQTLSVVAITQPSHGTVEISEGLVVYKPEADYNGEVTFEYTIADQWNARSTSTITLKIAAQNDAPTASPLQKRIERDTTLTLNVEDLASDVDQLLAKNEAAGYVREAQTLSIVIEETKTTHGSVKLVDGKLVYTPDNSFSGTDYYTFKVVDQTGAFATALLTIDVGFVNHAPVAVQDNDQEIDENEAATFDVIRNDYDLDADPTYNTTGTLDTFNIVSAVATVGNVEVTSDNQLIYTPLTNFNGTVEITYTIQDSHNAKANSTFTVVVKSVNTAPVAVNDNVSGFEDHVLEIDPLINDDDADADRGINLQPGIDFEKMTIKIVAVTKPEHGRVEFSDHRIFFMPEDDFNGETTFSYTIEDETGLRDQAQITVYLKSEKDAPVAVDDYISVEEDDEITYDLRLLDTDVDLIESLNKDKFEDISTRGLKIVDVESTPLGEVSFTETAMTFEPKENYTGPIALLYTIEDETGLRSQATVYITVTPVNDAPKASDYKLELDEDTDLSTNVVNEFTDADLSSTLNFPMTEIIQVTITVEPLYGRVEVNGTIITYTPKENYNGKDEITYQVKDRSGAWDTGKIEYKITPENDAPIAKADTVQAFEDQSVTYNVVVNDGDVDNIEALNQSENYDFNAQTLTIKSVEQPSAGTVTFINQEITYVPAPDYNGVVIFSYTVQDQNGLTSQATVTINVANVNDAPVVTDQIETLAEDGHLATNVVSIATDKDLDPSVNFPVSETHTVTIVRQPLHGRIEIDGTTITYYPVANYNGLDEIIYQVQDKSGAKDTAIIAYVIDAKNDAPIALADASEMNEDQTITVDVLANDGDVDRDPLLNLAVGHRLEEQTLTIKSITQPTIGVAKIENNQITYQPIADYNGVQTLSYTVEDQDGETSQATLTITVNAVNDAPQAHLDVVKTDEDVSVMIDVLKNDVDIDQDRTLNRKQGYDFSHQILSIVSISPSQLGQAIIKDHQIYFVPNANVYGTETLTYVIEDQAGLRSSAQVEITIESVNDAPTQPVIIEPLSTIMRRATQQVRVVWNPSQDVDGDTVYYDVYYYDGTSWMQLAKGLLETHYDHLISQTSTTSSAYYRIVAHDDQTQSQSESIHFIVDNEKPIGSTLQWICAGGTQSCTQYSGFILTSGSDLTEVHYYYRYNDQSPWIEVKANEFVQFSTNEGTVSIKLIDAVGNETVWTQTIERGNLPETSSDPTKPSEPTSPSEPTTPSDPKDYTMSLQQGLVIGTITVAVLWCLWLYLGSIRLTYQDESGKRYYRFKRLRVVSKHGALALKDRKIPINHGDVSVNIGRFYSRYLRDKSISLEVNQQVYFVDKVDRRHRGTWKKKTTIS